MSMTAFSTRIDEPNPLYLCFFHTRSPQQEVLLPEAREEYANVLEDTRHPANKELYSAEELRRARDEAKAESERYSCGCSVKSSS